MNPLLRFEVTWTDPPGNNREAGSALAWGSSILYVADVPVWFVGSADAPKPVAWSWIELLEFLASRWLHLTTEQTYPFGLAVDDPRHLRSRARKAFGDRFFDDEVPDDVDDAVFRFEGRHDLARALRGVTLPSVFVLREGDTVRVSADSGQHVVERRGLFRQLESIGDVIAARLDAAKSDRARVAIEAWRRRRSFSAKQLVSVATGDANAGTPSLEFWELANEPGADSELAAAARFMAGARPSEHDFDVILASVKQAPRVQCARLDELAGALKSILEDTRQKDHYEQGYALAIELRRELRVSDERPVDVEKIVRDLGVIILDQTLSSSIDAVGCWGSRHGPAIVVNTAGRRSGKTHGRRATIAHELCHLLADRATALPLAEVIGGASPYLPERRANAFAAEFLLPRWQARVAYKEKQSIDKALAWLKMRYHVGQVLAAGQLLNASYTGVSQSERAKLESIVKEDRD